MIRDCSVPDSIVQLAVDNTRNTLYSRSEKGTIQVHLLKGLCFLYDKSPTVFCFLLYSDQQDVLYIKVSLSLLFIKSLTSLQRGAELPPPPPPPPSPNLRKITTACSEYRGYYKVVRNEFYVRVART